jgi:hypothetical protein
MTLKVKGSAGLAALTLFLAAGAIAIAFPPAGWFFAGTKPQEYICSVDPEAAYNGQPSTSIKSREGVTTTGFGSMMQNFSAAQYVGKRIRLSGNLKSVGVNEWGGLWMRVDGDNSKSLAFDNMHDGLKDQSVKGATDWKNYSIVLDVPEGASGIYIGFLLSGPGTLWVNGLKVDVVGPEVPVTGQPMTRAAPAGPSNLGFEK